LIFFGVLFFAVPAFAQTELLGTISIGLGRTFGQGKAAPYSVAAKYWDKEWEVGGQLYISGDVKDEFEQMGLVYGVVKYVLSGEDFNTTYIGVGGGAIFDEDQRQDETHSETVNFKEQIGVVGIAGWDSGYWGIEVTYGYFNPSLIAVNLFYTYI